MQENLCVVESSFNKIAGIGSTNLIDSEIDSTQSVFTCSTLTVETLDKVWNMFKVNNKDTRTIYILNIFHTLI